ncbi:MAG TPA: ABC transporter permease, partial [Alphaproteobacteria bacterium]|nr:ABC transporter permease [Alphaproteobacteria bacterium]
MKSVLKIVLQRLGLGLLTLFVVSLIIFSAIELLPGGFAEAILGQAATPETVAAFNKEIGLDKPAPQRYVEWVSKAVQGDFGTSFSSRVGYRRTVAEILAPRAYNTAFLAIMTALISVPLSVGLGLLAALYRNSIFDRAINMVSLVSISFP